MTSVGEDFLDLTPKTKGTKAKINKWVYIKLKHFYTVKENTSEEKKQLTKWEKIFANHICDQRLISHIYYF